MASDTFSVRLTESNENHETPRRIMKEWMDAGYSQQDVLLNALYLLANKPIPQNQKGAERQLINRLVELVPRLERAISKIESGQIAPSAVREVISEELDNGFLESIGSYFDSTQ